MHSKDWAIPGWESKASDTQTTRHAYDNIDLSNIMWSFVKVSTVFPLSNSVALLQRAGQIVLGELTNIANKGTLYCHNDIDNDFR